MHFGLRETNVSRLRRGFSLIELMVVLLIILILFGLSARMSTNVISSFDLSTSTDQVLDIFTRAREESTSSNRSVQIRIYQIDGEYREIGVGFLEAPGDPSDPNYNNPEEFEFRGLSTTYRLPESVAFLIGDDYSTLIQGFDSLDPDEDLTVIEGVEEIQGEPTNYVAISFSPSSRVRLAATELWTLTLALDADVQRETELPANFSTIILDPNTARATVARPN